MTGVCPRADLRGFDHPAQLKRSPVHGSFDGDFGCTSHAARNLGELQFDDYFFRRRSFTRQAMAAGDWSGMAKTELTLISQST